MIFQTNKQVIKNQLELNI